MNGTNDSNEHCHLETTGKVNEEFQPEEQVVKVNARCETGIQGRKKINEIVEHDPLKKTKERTRPERLSGVVRVVRTLGGRSGTGFRRWRCSDLPRIPSRERRAKKMNYGWDLRGGEAINARWLLIRRERRRKKKEIWTGGVTPIEPALEKKKSNRNWKTLRGDNSQGEC